MYYWRKAAPNLLLSGDYAYRTRNVNFQFKTIVVKEVRDAIVKTKTNKGFGNDDIFSYFLKLALLFIEKSLADLFNTSIETSLFPHSEKLPKLHQSLRMVKNLISQKYRPISVLPVIARLHEKFVANQLHQYMTDNSYFSPDQSGFLPLHFTVTSLLKNSDDWYNGLDLGKLAGVVYS